MKTLLKLLAAMGLATFGLAGAVMAAPASSCTGNGTTSPILCDLFEEDANGAFSELGWDVKLGGPVSVGNVPVFEGPNGNADDPRTWSDEIIFADDGSGFASTVRLISEGCGIGEGDISCFLPALNAPNPPTEDPITEIAVWNVGNIYTVHSLAADVPEPATLALLGAAFAGIGFARRRRSKLD